MITSNSPLDVIAREIEMTVFEKAYLEHYGHPPPRSDWKAAWRSMDTFVNTSERVVTLMREGFYVLQTITRTSSGFVGSYLDGDRIKTAKVDVLSWMPLDVFMTVAPADARRSLRVLANEPITSRPSMQPVTAVVAEDTPKDWPELNTVPGGLDDDCHWAKTGFR